jgi:sec-independent protein translocase protein TatA
MPLGVPELIIILVIVIVVFGAGKLSGLGSGLGRAIRDFRSEVKDKPEDTTKVERHS